MAHETYLRAAYDIILSHRDRAGRAWKIWAITLAVLAVGGFAGNGIAGIIFLLAAYGCWVMYIRRRPVRISDEDAIALNTMYPNHGVQLAITRYDERKVDPSK